LLTRNLNFTRTYLESLQKVTADDVRRVATQYLSDENLTIVSLNPKGTRTGKAETPPPLAAGEIQKIELSNGLRLLVREDPRLPLVAITVVFRGGLLAETRDNNGVTRLMAKTLLKGTRTRSAEQIAETIEAVGGSISSEAGNNSFSVSLDVTAPDLNLGAELLADLVLNATLPEGAIAREKEVQIAGITEEEEQVTVVARNLLREALFREHPFALRGKGSVQSVTNLTRDDLIAFRDRFLVARNGVISVFGNVKVAEVKEIFENALAAMRTGELALVNPPQPPSLSRPTNVESLKDKAQGVIMVGYHGVDIFSPDRYALELIDEASSDLGSRFFVRIREQMGLAYYVGAGQMQGLVPGLFLFYLGTDPAKIEPVKTALLDEINTLAADGLTEEELSRAKKKLIGQQQIANQSNDTFGYMAALDELYGLGFDHHKELERQVDAVEVDDVKRVAAKYFQQQPYVLATVRPPDKPRQPISK
jgi:zinc protease